ncbi:hypothetical protein KQH82_02560 [bacterium]|nr:hypothetical protein [bacterium]
MRVSKQTKANRANAQKSTGPITDEGKAIVAQNAVTHGLHSTRVVINSPHLKEDPDEYRLLLGSLIWELEPVGVLQHHLVHKIANALWRYKRVIRAETGALERQLDYATTRDYSLFREKPDLDTEQGRAHYQILLDQRKAAYLDESQIPSESDSVKLLRYELRLDRQITRAHKLLRRLQRLDRAARAAEEAKSQKKHPKK